MTSLKSSRAKAAKGATPRWPNFFIVGAPRCGTSSLNQYLSGHPDIYMSPFKEPHFFDEVVPPKVRAFREEEGYLKLFERAGNKVAIGEATPSYLSDETAPRRIYEKVPNAKIIILLREPIARTYSHYRLRVSLSQERDTFYQAVARDYGCPRKNWAGYHLYVGCSLYYEQVKRYLDTFGRQNVRIYLLEDMASDPMPMIKDVCDFLGVPFYEGRFFDPSLRFNVGRVRVSVQRRLLLFFINLLLRRISPSLNRRFSLSRRLARFRAVSTLNSTLQAEPFIEPEAREFLYPIFRDDILKLQDLIGRDLSHWLSQERVSEK